VLKPRHYEDALRSGGIGPHILEIDIGYRSVANFRRQPLHPLVISADRRPDVLQSLSGRCGEKEYLTPMLMIMPNPSIIQPVN
jgi:hypothetical protein